LDSHIDRAAALVNADPAVALHPMNRASRVLNVITVVFAKPSFLTGSHAIEIRHMPASAPCRDA
jgi:hypothetical protein